MIPHPTKPGIVTDEFNGNVREWYVAQPAVGQPPWYSDAVFGIKDERKLSFEFMYEMAWYVGRCELAGFCKTNDQVRLIAERYIAGKRKVSPPGTQRRKNEADAVRKALANVPAELAAAVKAAVASPVGVQVVGGNDKAKNSLIGMVMKQYKTTPALVMQLLDIEINAMRNK